MKKKKYWGWQHEQGAYTVLEFFTQKGVDKSREYSFIKQFVEPFESENIETALEYIKNKCNGI